MPRFASGNGLRSPFCAKKASAAAEFEVPCGGACLEHAYLIELLRLERAEREVPQFIGIERTDRLIRGILPAGQVDGDEGVLHGSFFRKHGTHKCGARVGLDMYSRLNQLVGGWLDVK